MFSFFSIAILNRTSLVVSRSLCQKSRDANLECVYKNCAKLFSYISARESVDPPLCLPTWVDTRGEQAKR